MELFGILFSALLVNNIILTRFLALFSFFGSPTDIKASIWIGFVATIAVVISSAISWIVNTFIFFPSGLEFMGTAVFVLTVVLSLQVEEFYLKKLNPSLYASLESLFSLITTNCAILAVAIIAVNDGFSFIQTVVYSLGVSGGYFLVIFLFVHLKEKMAVAPIPKWFQGYPIAFITAALMSLAFMGFIGMF